MPRYCPLLTLLLLLGLIPGTVQAIELSAGPAITYQPVKIVDVFAEDSTAYDEPSTVRILVAHDGLLLPGVIIFYMPLLQNRTFGVGWRISPAQVVQSFPDVNETLYWASVPNPIFSEELPTGTVIVYYVEAHDASGSALTSRQQDRWNPLVADDKFTIRLIDLYPPSISSVSLMPDQPASGQEVTVTANVTDGKLGSGVSAVTLSYSVDYAPFTSVAMTLFENDTYAASIPALQHDHKVALFVTAVDKAGNMAKTGAVSYVVQKNAEELAAEQRANQFNTLLGGSAAFVVILGVAVWKRRTVAVVVKRQTALTIGIILVFLIAARVAFVLWTIQGLLWWNAIILIALVEFWALVDPRIQGTLRPLITATLEFGKSLTTYLSKTFQENPPTILIAAAYVLGFAGAVSDIILLLATRDLSYAYVLANFIAEYVFILLALGVIGQIIMLSRKKP